MDKFLTKLQKIYGNYIKTNVSLSNYIKIGIGGQSKYFLPCKNLESFTSAITAAQKNNILYFALKYNDDILILPKIIERLVIFLLAPSSNPPKTITLFQMVKVNNDIKKILDNKNFMNDFLNAKYISPNDILFKMGLVNKVFGGLKQLPDKPNIAINFQQATIDDVIIMSSYLKQQVRDSLDIQLKDNYKFIYNN